MVVVVVVVGAGVLRKVIIIGIIGSKSKFHTRNSYENSFRTKIYGSW